MVLSLAPAMLTLFGHAVWWLPRWLANLLRTSTSRERRNRPPGERPSSRNSTALPPGERVGRPMPTTDAWPEPSTPIRETTAPGDGDGRGGHVPDD